ncbi:hypothetical protein MIR68_001503 [Amoeboaphelidium protococcarum]|nr:hypothetical protein MIR68_001503 [Amoeboaphelidium protococcarum]
MSQVTVYYSSVSGNMSIKKNQQAVLNVLDGKKVPYKLVDVAADEKARVEMKQKSGKATLPQVFVDGQFKGGFEDFELATEDGKLNEFFGQSGVF